MVLHYHLPKGKLPLRSFIGAKETKIKKSFSMNNSAIEGIRIDKNLLI